MKKHNWYKIVAIIMIGLNVVTPMMIFMNESSSITPVVFPISNVQYIAGEDKYTNNVNSYIDTSDVVITIQYEMYDWTPEQWEEWESSGGGSGSGSGTGGGSGSGSGGGSGGVGGGDVFSTLDSLNGERYTAEVGAFKMENCLRYSEHDEINIAITLAICWANGGVVYSMANRTSFNSNIYSKNRDIVEDTVNYYVAMDCSSFIFYAYKIAMGGRYNNFAIGNTGWGIPYTTSGLVNEFSSYEMAYSEGCDIKAGDILFRRGELTNHVSIYVGDSANGVMIVHAGSNNSGDKSPDGPVDGSVYGENDMDRGDGWENEVRTDSTVGSYDSYYDMTAFFNDIKE
jgi:hypothetical protein